MDFTKQEYLKDVKLILAVYAQNLWRVLPDNYAELLREVDLEAAFDSGPGTEAELKKMDSFFNTDFFQWFDYCYEYGINGRYNEQRDPGLVEQEDFFTFWESLVSAADFLSNNFDGKAEFRFERISHVLEKMRTRMVMDNLSWSELPGHIYLTELANLADLDEKTIRNIASKKPDGFPKIVKSGTRSLVDKEEARAWLIKRGWKETERISDQAQSADLTSGFKSFADLNSKVHQLLVSSVLPGKDHPVVKKWVEDFEESLEVNIKAIKVLSQASGTDVDQLLDHVLSLKKQLEHTRLKKQLSSI